MLRADHTSLHSYERDTTPYLDSFASKEDAVAFQQCFATHPKTYASVTSMMTGLYPSRHQVGIGNKGKRIPKQVATVPELLQTQGYNTIGISGGWAGPGIGLDERFDRFVNPNFSTLTSYPHIKTMIKYFANLRAHGPGYTVNKSKHSEQTGYYTTDVAKRELSSLTSTDKPFFTYIHYMDPHNPFYPPKDTEATYTDSPARGYEVAKKMHEDPYQLMADGLSLTEGELDLLVDMYDSVIKYTDKCVGDLINFIQRSFENTIIVVTSDHGVLLGEYDLLGHRIALHDAVTHVPLAVYGLPGLTNKTDKLVQHIDIMQTLLEEVGADVSQFQGYNLFKDTREYAISQYHKSTELTEEFKIALQNHPDQGELFDPSVLTTAFRTQDYKFIQTPDWQRLFKLPDEHTDKIDSLPDLSIEFSRFASEWLETEGKELETGPEEADLSSSVEHQLRELGYLR